MTPETVSKAPEAQKSDTAAAADQKVAGGEAQQGSVTAPKSYLPAEMQQRQLPQRVGEMRSGGGISAIVPQTLEDAFRLGNAIVKAGMAPKSITSGEMAAIAILHGLEVGLTPMAAMQSIAVVNGMPTIWGDGAIGLVRASGICEYIKEWTEGEGAELVAWCESKRKGEDTPIKRSFSKKQADTAGLTGKNIWKQYLHRMLQMRARGLVLRDGYADVLKGLHITEEAQDYEILPNRAGTPANGKRSLAEKLSGQQGGGFHPDHVNQLNPQAEPQDAEFQEMVLNQNAAGATEQEQPAVQQGSAAPENTAFIQRMQLDIRYIELAKKHGVIANDVAAVLEAGGIDPEAATHEEICEAYAAAGDEKAPAAKVTPHDKETGEVQEEEAGGLDDRQRAIMDATQKGVDDCRRGQQIRAVPPEYRNDKELAEAWKTGHKAEAARQADNEPPPHPGRR